jgi:cytochrome c peroxidase
MRIDRPLPQLITLSLGLLFAVQAAGLPIPPSLSAIPIPKVTGLETGPNPIIRDMKAARQLGKALFWDMSVGSDGVACATCHFHAGADRRHQNQLDSGTKHQGADSAQTFETLPSGQPGGPNVNLTKQDFPLFRLENPVDKASRVVFSTDDVVSSSGVFLGDYQSHSNATTGEDNCKSKTDPLFHLGAMNTRRVSVRNAPTIYNAAFNYRNFWDGRANNLFNGVSPYGPRDTSAGVWVLKDQKAVFTSLLLENSSLASQAVAPPLDDREMSCQGRRFLDLARKLLPQKPLLRQHVSEGDSLLGDIRNPNGRGLQGDYQKLVQKAFNPRFWSQEKPLEHGSEPTTRQIEANFAFFFGLAIQSYENTLISDKTRFDGARNSIGEPLALSEAERRGLGIFKTECMLCHQGPTFSAAAHPEVYSIKSARHRLVDRREINGDFDGSGLAVALIDIGFSNTSVTPTDYDVGLGGTDPYGNPLSFSEQFFSTLKDPQGKMIDQVEISVCDFQRPFHMDFQDAELTARTDPACGRDQRVGRIPAMPVVEQESQKFERGRLLIAVQGAFKIPGLRNVELTGPYMHNGSMKNLEEVLDFYDRGGNHTNPHHVGNLVFPRPFPKIDRDDLVAFLKSLTDERVRWERAPFDHPELWVNEGFEEFSEAKGKEISLHIPATGRGGRSTAEGPLKPFEEYLP